MKEKEEMAGTRLKRRLLDEYPEVVVVDDEAVEDKDAGERGTGWRQ